MSHRREQKEALRRERERREAEAKAAAQRKRLLGIVGAVVLGVAAIAVVVVVAAGSGGGDGGSGVKGNEDIFPSGGSIPKQKEFDLPKAAAAAGCELKSSPGVETGHVTDPNQRVKYKDNPPTTGRHYEVPADDGLYNGAPPPDTALVHALEHSRVIVWAKPTLPRPARQQIRALFDEDSYQLIVVKRANMPYAVAATAWNGEPRPNGTGRTLGCVRWNEKGVDALRAFRDEHRSNGLEAVP